MSLHGAWRYEQPRRDVLVAQAFTDEFDDVEFGRGQRIPTGRGALAATELTGPINLPVELDAVS
jgi:hypothetical protein